MDFGEMQRIIQTMNVDETKRWLFQHTRNEAEYKQVKRALDTLAQFTPVDWIGPTGDRVAVEQTERKRV